MADMEIIFRNLLLHTSSMLSGISIPSGGEKGSGAFSLFSAAGVSKFLVSDGFPASFCGGGFGGGGGLLVSYCCCF